MNHASPSQPSATDRVSEDDIHFVMRLFARGEVESLIRHRVAVHHLRYRTNHPSRIASLIDSENDLEGVLQLVECLPQETRTTLPPQSGFLSLAKAILGEEERPEKVLEYAILLEEHALETCSSHSVQPPEAFSGERVSPWAIPSEAKRRLLNQNEDVHSRKDAWIARQCHKMLAAVFAGEFPGSARPRYGHLAPDRLVDGRRVRRVRKRRRQHGEYSHRDSDSSDNYNTSEGEPVGNGLNPGGETTAIGTVMEGNGVKGCERSDLCTADTG